MALSAFGLSLIADVPPPGAWEARPSTEPSLRIRPGTRQAIASSWSGREEIGWEGMIDGAPFVVERGVAGDHRFVHGTLPDERGTSSADERGTSSDHDRQGTRHGARSRGTRAIHHLSADASLLQCAPLDPDDPSWWRVVLDSVLFTVALLHGYEALHAGAVATPDGVIAVTAASGGGKSTLLSELLGRGLALMTDDVLVLEAHSAEPTVAHPGPPLMTVPAARMLAPVACAPAEAICKLEDELWIAVPAHPDPLPLRALVVLDRRAGSELSMEKIEDPFAPLLGSLMNFPRTPERQRARFELASALASETTLWRLAADLDTPPEVLADTLLNSLAAG